LTTDIAKIIYTEVLEAKYLVSWIGRCVIPYNHIP
jgi:hypothetical protein